MGGGLVQELGYPEEGGLQNGKQRRKEYHPKKKKKKTEELFVALNDMTFQMEWAYPFARKRSNPK